MKKMITQSIRKDSKSSLKTQLWSCFGLFLSLLISTATFGQEPAPANDEPCFALEALCGVSYEGTTVNATDEIGRASCRERV